MICERCSIEFSVAVGARAKYCVPCRPIVVRERSAKRYYEKVRPNIETIANYEVSRDALAEARIAGDKHYVGAPCKYGHISRRLVSTQQCCECLRLRKLTMRVMSDEQLTDIRRNQIKRGFAKNLGLTRFKTLLSCKHGHMSERLVSTNQCCECLALRVKDAGKPASDAAIRRTNARRRSRAGKVKNRAYYSAVLSKCNRHKLTSFMRSCVRRTLIYKGGAKSKEQLGYDHFQLKAHLESLFTDGMSWENYGDWHIDHIRPIQDFLNSGVVDPRIINALSNLQPMWAFENLSKGKNYSV